MNNLYNWIFHFNPITNKWNAVKRENYNELFSGNSGNVLKSDDINTLIYLIKKTDGNKEKLNNLINSYK